MLNATDEAIDAILSFLCQDGVEDTLYIVHSKL